MKINEKNLCVFATSPPYDCFGFLNKRGEVNKAFQRRYFVLKGNLLFYFEKNGDKEPLGLIIVEGCTIELSEEESDQYCFEIAFNGNRSYVLSADTQEVMESWMKALTCAGYEYKKLMVAELQRQLEEIEETRNKMLDESLHAVVPVPKPPPRRQNPFNRPAPPLPTMNGTSSGSFINGHFNAGTQQTQSAVVKQQTDNTGSPVPPPRGALQQEQQQQQRQQQQQKQQYETSAKQKDTVFASTSSSASVAELLHYKTSSFDQRHESMRKLVMKDVIAYRELKAPPIIDL